MPSVVQGASVTLTFDVHASNPSGPLTDLEDVTITIEAADASATVIEATSVGVRHPSTGIYTYVWDTAADLDAGDYLATWSGTDPTTSGTVTGTDVVEVDLAASPSSYATLAQYRAQPGGSSSSDAAVLDVLPQASQRLDEMLIGALYEVDEDGMPTDAATARIFMRATCAQARYMLDMDDPTGAKGRFVNVSEGSISYSRAPDSAGVGKDRFAPEAISILRVEGVLPISALTYW